ncbi:MAG TPA: hypothetical protein DIU35_10515 [Candidatus Latescibacteria bacterium]|nr:hypothetical protein [Gemmatimonadota bacterium]HCR17903.1 hypothetical protein [Candidatus Latescibacterota bacterium]
MVDPTIAIIGAGALSTRRIYPYIDAAGAVLVGVCNLERDKAERNARRFGGRVYDDFREMLNRESPDGVIICVGTEGHAELAPVVLQMGYPVYAEKSPAPSSAAALEVGRVAKETGLLCMTAFKKRYTVANNRERD